MNTAHQPLWEFLEQRLRLGDVPRVVDLVSYARENLIQISRKDIVEALNQHPTYMFNMEQHRMTFRSNKQRPVLGVNLGHLHADIGFFSKSRQYETPPRFQAGFLVAKDVFSKFVYIVLLRGNRRSASIISAFEKVFELHKRAGHVHPIRSVGFDKETSVLSKAVQSFFAANNIRFVSFSHTSSKSKLAENAIKTIRTLTARLIRQSNNTSRWWNLLPGVADTLNSREIYVGGKPTGFVPSKIGEDNLEDYIQVVYKLSPSHFFSQFSIDSRLVKFKFEVGTVCRAKLIATLSQVIGEKRSATNVTQATFVILEQIPYVARDLSLAKAYKCRNLSTQEVEIFDQQDLTLSQQGHDALWTH